MSNTDKKPPCMEWPLVCQYKTIGLPECPRCGHICWYSYLQWEKFHGIKLNEDLHHLVEVTEDRCECCGYRNAPLAVMMMLHPVAARIDVVTYPMCEWCYQTALDTDNTLIRVVRDPLPKDFPVKSWSKQEYAEFMYQAQVAALKEAERVDE